MSATPADWRTLRPYRNKNPGDLRTLKAPDHWIGQTGTDNGPGGPFAMFDTEANGWRALAMCLLTYQDVHKLKTIRTMFNRFAPPVENNTKAYIDLMAKQIGVIPDAIIDAHKVSVMDALCKGCALAEGGARIQWSDAARANGIMAALATDKTTRHS